MRFQCRADGELPSGRKERPLAVCRLHPAVSYRKSDCLFFCIQPRAICTEKEVIFYAKTSIQPVCFLRRLLARGHRKPKESPHAGDGGDDYRPTCHLQDDGDSSGARSQHQRGGHLQFRGLYGLRSRGGLGRLQRERPAGLSAPSRRSLFSALYAGGYEQFLYLRSAVLEAAADCEAKLTHVLSAGKSTQIRITGEISKKKYFIQACHD